MVDQLPLAVRIAMLEGVRAERIIAGGYADGTGGVCPMLAAHRHGGRWSFPDFARTWDEFAEAPIEGLRPADPVHVEALADVLTASIEDDLRVDAALPDTIGTGAAPHPSAPVPHAPARVAARSPAHGVPTPSGIDEAAGDGPRPEHAAARRVVAGR
ncbi:hypothetical protein [Patulibacter minatonensis]|uniref:hypothetical protein n=1 Tax=Patulibacter minatonensis TaxID=298163 RepID=UPI0012FCD46A|nr:hypothetical protein [Patulibacter minatonensis]